MVTIGLIGCGTIGSHLAHAIQDRFKGIARLVGIYDTNPLAAQRLSRALSHPVPFLPLKKLISQCQLLIEAASPVAVQQILPRILARRKAVLVMSTGGLLNNRRLLHRAVSSRTPVYLPSGALVGLDGIKGGAVGKLRSVTLTTYKPPRSFENAPEVLRRKIRLRGLRSPRVLFEGSASRAVKAFPQNINVAATLALAGIGPSRTRVRIVADPRVQTNIHEIEAIGTFGRLVARTENRPYKENPRTSQMAVFSAIATLQQVLQPIRVGT